MTLQAAWRASGSTWRGGADFRHTVQAVVVWGNAGRVGQGAQDATSGASVWGLHRGIFLTITIIFLFFAQKCNIYFFTTSILRPIDLFLDLTVKKKEEENLLSFETHAKLCLVPFFAGDNLREKQLHSRRKKACTSASVWLQAIFLE